MSAVFAQPLQPLEKQAKTHAILCSIGFLVLLPIGALIARYSRTFTTKWLLPHWTFQFVFAAPVIFAGWALGYKTSEQLGLGHFIDTHQKCGLALLILYLVQLTLGTAVHFFKFPTTFHGHRPPHSYLHVAVGIAIFILAAYQSHYGLYTEWPIATGGLHVVPLSAKHAWLALVVIFWGLYGLGMGLLLRQFKQESQFRAKMRSKESEDH
ncbi:hypothetical protein AN958_12243 [Leucoagaricus sp. SymC.cos]|nr:hypothetical protein AN958_12243 [Leucoagaricus sp. SymC.cos]